MGGEGRPVVEDDYGEGTARGHWNQNTYGDELMTGFLTGTNQPMSKLTVLSLKDLGYVVDASKADPYTIPADSNNLLGQQVNLRGMLRKALRHPRQKFDRHAWKVTLCKVPSNSTSLKPGRSQDEIGDERWFKRGNLSTMHSHSCW